MSITSMKFIIFSLSFVVLYLLSNIKLKKYILIMAGFIFYYSFNSYGVIYLILISFLSYFLTKNINKNKLMVIIGSVLGSLIFFKVNNLYSIVGISFISFKVISYAVDVYQNKIGDVSFTDYLVYVSFFPVITAGPIIRYSDFKSNYEADYENVKSGFVLFMMGIFVKLVVVHRMSEITGFIFNNRDLSATYYLLGVLLYSFELYFDFDAYSNMAIGLANMFGYEVKANFKTPYFSKNMSEFYKRWHISLSSWFKDYVYIPLGGYNNRYLNILIVSLLSGLWHGFNLPCLFWGLYHGLIQIFNHRLKYKNMVLTFCLVSFGWIFFRSSSLNEAFFIIGKLFSSDYGSFDIKLFEINWMDFNATMLFIIIMIVLDYFRYKFEVFKWVNRQHFIVRWSLYLGLIFVFLIFGRYGIDYQAGDFIYQSF